MASGCTDWDTAAPCQTGHYCSGGTCVKSCADQCTDGAKQCQGTGLSTCKKMASGCTDWDTPAACQSGYHCSGGTCVKTCANQCTAGAVKCSGSGVATCKTMASGCTDWDTPSACQSGYKCSGGKCVKTCADQCTAGVTQCSGSGVSTCIKMSSGCTDWDTPAACQSGYNCSGGTCVKTCSNQCTLGAVKCSGSGVVTCIKMSSGCTDWDAPAPCQSGYECSGGTCVKTCSDQCAAGNTKCSGTGVSTCKKMASGCTDWDTPAACQSGYHCSGGKCVKTCTNQCASGATKCSGTGVTTCKLMASGCTDWDTPAPCQAGYKCSGGKCVKTCTDQCTSGTAKCSGTSVVTCKKMTSGCTDWDTPVPCATGYLCSAGKCVVDGLVITKNTELCGEKSYSGNVTIQGGVRVTCTTGSLTIKAKNIFIDPASSIDLSGTSSAAPAGDFGTCSPSYCYSSYGRAGGAGGGNGTAGEKAPGVSYKYRNSQYGSCSCATCYGGSGGGERDDKFHLQVLAGGAGGKGCSSVDTYSTPPCKPNNVRQGGKGGGVVRLFAEDKITLYGKVLSRGAVGQDGTKSIAAGTGGGAGGSVLLAAPSVELTGSVDTSGAKGGPATYFSASCYVGKTDPRGGNGGQGRIKIVHGSSYKNSGSLVGGVQSISYMPPLTVTSSSHPDQTLYFNNRFSSFTFSWTKPYADVKGYYYLLDKISKTQVTPANGSYSTATSVTLPAITPMASGTWHFHLATVHKDSKTSTVAHRFSVKVTASPPQITSSSHPDKNAWYAGASKKTLNFDWKNLYGATDASFKGYWYRLDHDSSYTPPSSASPASGWTFTKNKQIILQKDHAGAALTDWTYYFRLVAEDTRGNVTTMARSYRVQLGNEPSTMNFFGYITSGSTKLSGVKVRLEPYGHEALTDGNGYYIFTGIYQGSYALTATKSGHTAHKATIKAMPASVPYNFSM